LASASDPSLAPQSMILPLIAAALRFRPSRVSKWTKRKRETGSLAPAQIGGLKPRTLSGESAHWLLARIAAGTVHAEPVAPYIGQRRAAPDPMGKAAFSGRLLDPLGLGRPIAGPLAAPLCPQRPEESVWSGGGRIRNALNECWGLRRWEARRGCRTIALAASPAGGQRSRYTFGICYYYRVVTYI
jgi:hypothetical protein